MDQKFQDFEKSIKGKHSFNFTPKYKEEFSIKVTPRIFVEIAAKTFEALAWEVVFQDDHQIEAKRPGSFDKWTHGIVATANPMGKVVVKSESLGNEMWDLGKNSKRVKLFIYAFNEILKTYDESQLKELQEEVERKDNWDDYEVPEKLPAPANFRQPQLWVPALGIGIVALLLAYLIAFLSMESVYVIGLFELGAGFILGFSLKELMKLGNYTKWASIKNVLIGAVVLTFVMNQIFQYQMILSRNPLEPIGFFEYMKLRIEHGFTLKEINLGAIGLVIFWAVQIGLTYLIAYLKTLNASIKISMERVPVEVVDFTIYHFVKGKNELAVKQELSKMGWKSELEHEMVFEAIGGVHGGQELRRL
ncbi:hypothetical protein [Marinifilum caeruleilacunae]|uniref:Uncharacterized protein n=1 Tax=Marinifilum caeruleilacunae TaxID=2499076 RepID=A0ABX1X2D1_9BACT|nr:hypothetical protein [Marinifilum caeruleilacunae]NOU62243.1 hypothetical protein [Marinifilum caeruleilacunae]